MKYAKKYLKAARTLLLLLKYLVSRQHSRLTDSRLGVLLRTQVHGVEKGFAEDTSNLISMVWARKLYYEAKRRNILSQEESEWCQRVLFAEQVGSAIRSGASFDEGFMEVIKSRRSVRSWGDEGLTESEFEQLVDSARWAPSSSNRQTWHFLLTSDRDKIKFLSEIRGQKFVANAPSCIVVLIDMQLYDEVDVHYTPYLDAGAAIQNLLLEAHSLGYGACWVNFGAKEVAREGRGKVKVALGIPAGYEIVSIIPIGKPKVIPRPPGRKSLSQILHMEVFQGK